MKKLLCLGFMLATANVMADAGNQFTFSLNSSDDKMYVCNVGIRHANGLSNNGDLITSGYPLNTHDYVSVNYNTLDSDMVSGTATNTAFLATAAFQDLATLTSNNFLKTKINSLVVNLGSEQYGAEFYVDICYRGNQLDFNTYNIATDYKLTYNQITFTNSATSTYISSAALQVRSETACDTQLTGTRTGASPSLDVGATLTAILANITSADVSFLSNSGAYTNVATSGVAVNFLSSNVSLTGPASNKDAPSFCRTRYYVKENSTSERNWKGVGGTFATKTEILNFL